MNALPRFDADLLRRYDRSVRPRLHNLLLPVVAMCFDRYLSAPTLAAGPADVFQGRIEHDGQVEIAADDHRKK
jgi:hypothetical protein